MNFWFFLFICCFFEKSFGNRLQFMKTANVPRENYLILNYTVPMVADSNDETVLVHSLEIRLVIF